MSNSVSCLTAEAGYYSSDRLLYKPSYRGATVTIWWGHVVGDWIGLATPKYALRIA